MRSVFWQVLLHISIRYCNFLGRISTFIFCAFFTLQDYWFSNFIEIYIFWMLPQEYQCALFINHNIAFHLLFKFNFKNVFKILSLIYIKIKEKKTIWKQENISFFLNYVVFNKSISIFLNVPTKLFILYWGFVKK